MHAKAHEVATIEERVKTIVAKQLHINEEEVVNMASFVEDLGADTLDLVELKVTLEKEFQTGIPDEEAEKITTVQAAIDYVTYHQA
jgi:acyl carrier protein